MAKDKFKQMQKGGGGSSSFQRLAEQAATVAAIERQAGEVSGGPRQETNQSDLAQTQAQNPVRNNVSTSEAGTSTQISGATLGVTPMAVNGHPIEEIEAGREREPAVRYMRLPNPQIPLAEYNLVSAYCNSLDNMTRQDWVELAIVEKLNRDGLITEDDYKARRFEIRNRPRRGQRKGFRVIRDNAATEVNEQNGK